MHDPILFTTYMIKAPRHRRRGYEAEDKRFHCAGARSRARSWQRPWRRGRFGN